METQYLGPSKVEGIKDSNSEQQYDKQGQTQTKKELRLVAQKELQFKEKYVKNNEYVTMEICSLVKDLQCFIIDLLPLSPPIPKTTQKQCDEGVSRLALRLAIAEYHMAD